MAELSSALEYLHQQRIIHRYAPLYMIVALALISMYDQGLET